MALRVNTAALSAEMLGTLLHDAAVEVIGEVAGVPPPAVGGAAARVGGGEEGGPATDGDGGGGDGGVTVDARVARLLVGYDEDLYARSLQMRAVFEARYGPGGAAGR